MNKLLKIRRCVSWENIWKKTMRQQVFDFGKRVENNLRQNPFLAEMI